MQCSLRNKLRLKHKYCLVSGRYFTYSVGRLAKRDLPRLKSTLVLETVEPNSSPPWSEWKQPLNLHKNTQQSVAVRRLTSGVEFQLLASLLQDRAFYVNSATAIALLISESITLLLLRSSSSTEIEIGNERRGSTQPVTSKFAGDGAGDQNKYALEPVDLPAPVS